MNIVLIIILVIVGLIYFGIGGMFAVMNTPGNPSKLQEYLFILQSILIMIFWPIVLIVIFAIGKK